MDFLTIINNLPDLLIAATVTVGLIGYAFPNKESLNTEEDENNEKEKTQTELAMDHLEKILRGVYNHYQLKKFCDANSHCFSYENYKDHSLQYAIDEIRRYVYNHPYVNIYGFFG